MKIAVNTRFLLKGKLEGIGWFTHEIFKRLVQDHPEIEWHFLFDRSYDEEFIYGSNVTPHIVRPAARHPILWYIWYEWGVTTALKKIKPDLFISPDGYISLSSKYPVLQVLHDINFEHHPGYLPNAVAKYFRHYFPRFAKASTRLATVSQYSKNDISKTYHINPQKIDVVYNGVGNNFKPISAEEKKQAQSKADGQPYFVFVGALNPRKNLKGMLDAFDAYCNKGGKYHFIVVGEKMYWPPEIEHTYKNMAFKDRVHFIGRLEGPVLNQIVAGAEALLFVSYFEGFGIPIIEAFKAETLVITSTKTSMPEVGGDAALYADPYNQQEIVEKMFLAEDKDLMPQYISKGIERAKHFTWDNAAQQMWQSINNTLYGA